MNQNKMRAKTLRARHFSTFSIIIKFSKKISLLGIGFYWNRCKSDPIIKIIFQQPGSSFVEKIYLLLKKRLKSRAFNKLILLIKKFSRGTPSGMLKAELFSEFSSVRWEMKLFHNLAFQQGRFFQESKCSNSFGWNIQGGWSLKFSSYSSDI